MTEIFADSVEDGDSVADISLSTEPVVKKRFCKAIESRTDSRGRTYCVDPGLGRVPCPKTPKPTTPPSGGKPKTPATPKTPSVIKPTVDDLHKEVLDYQTNGGDPVMLAARLNMLTVPQLNELKKKLGHTGKGKAISGKKAEQVKRIAERAATAAKKKATSTPTVPTAPAPAPAPAPTTPKVTYPKVDTGNPQLVERDEVQPPPRREPKWLRDKPYHEGDWRRSREAFRDEFASELHRRLNAGDTVTFPGNAANNEFGLAVDRSNVAGVFGSAAVGVNLRLKDGSMQRITDAQAARLGDKWHLPTHLQFDRDLFRAVAHGEALPQNVRDQFPHVKDLSVTA